MGYISTKVADLRPSPTDRGPARNLWREVFGSTNKEEPNKKPVVPGGSYTRSIVNAHPATIRLLQALRSKAPGGWSDDRLAFSLIPSRSQKGFHNWPASVDSFINNSNVAKAEFDSPFANGLCFAVDSGCHGSLVSSPRWSFECFFNGPSSV